MIRFVGEPLLGCRNAKGDASMLGIATVFPQAGVVVTLPGIHATQRQAYTDYVDGERIARNMPPLTEEQRVEIWLESVDLLMEGDVVLIRPDPARMDLALAADELLQQELPPQRIRFLFVNNPTVREAIYHRGEAWRIQPLPRSDEEIADLIITSRVGVGGRPIYYYSTYCGTRVLTYTEFVELGKMGTAELKLHLAEIAELSRRRNRRGVVELTLFMCNLPADSLLPTNVATLDDAALRALHTDACSRLAAATPAPYQRDNPQDADWRNQMYRALVAPTLRTVADEDLLGLGDEYYMRIHWLSGARMEDDGVSVETASHEDEANDATVHELMCNIIRDYAGIAYLNIGRVVRSLSRRVATGGRREVYVVQFRPRGGEIDELHIIRFHKWGVKERLDEGKPMLQAMRESDEYSDYILDRRLACQQLGMNLTGRVWTRKIQEPYHGLRHEEEGTIIWSPYLQREYVAGVATDKISRGLLSDGMFAMRLARAMGRAAAVNLIVGRASPTHKVVFDDGDELLVTDHAGKVDRIVVADPTGAFTNFETKLEADAPAYAAPVRERQPFVADWQSFAAAYLESFVERFQQIQASYRRHPEAFDKMFHHRRRDPAGNLAHRWAMVLARLQAADPIHLADLIRAAILGT